MIQRLNICKENWNSERLGSFSSAASVASIQAPTTAPQFLSYVLNFCFLLHIILVGPFLKATFFVSFLSCKKACKKMYHQQNGRIKTTWSAKNTARSLWCVFFLGPHCCVCLAIPISLGMQHPRKWNLRCFADDFHPNGRGPGGVQQCHLPVCWRCMNVL